MRKIILRTILINGIAFLAICGLAGVASAQNSTRTIRIVNYNIQADTVGIATPGIVSPTCGLIEPYDGTGGTYDTNCDGAVTNGGVLEGIGEEIINGDRAQPIDVLALEETTSNPTTVKPTVDALNKFYAVYNYLYPTQPVYAMSPYQATEDGGTDDGNGPNALVYNTNTLQLLASVGIATPTGAVTNGGNGMYRQCVRYEFAPAGVTPGTNNEFYVYVSHYKASSGLVEDTNRLGEARIIRNDESTNVPANAGVLYVGDYNPDDNSGEPGYQTICSNAAPDGIRQGWGIDPLNTNASPSINWSSSTTSPQILFMLSEESYELRYRDDLQIMTSNVYYQVGLCLHYIPGTYHSFGNNATILYGFSINTNANTALNDLDPVITNATQLTSTALLEDLTGASDHLPIVADYTIPVPSPIITGLNLAGTNLILNVTNGITNDVYTLFMSTNLAAPLANWTAVASNTETSGNFTFNATNVVAPAASQTFYFLKGR